MDLPTRPGDQAPFSSALVDLAANIAGHGVDAAILVGYGSVDPVAAAVRTGAVSDAGIMVLEAPRVDDNRVYGLLCDNPLCCPPTGTAFDPATTVAAAAATYAGLTALPDRRRPCGLRPPLPARPANSRRRTRHFLQHGRDRALGPRSTSSPKPRMRNLAHVR